MSRPVLLDVNVVIALFDAEHVHHDLAHDWFADNRGRGWATTPLTENGVVRIIANPKYGSNSERAAQVAARLRTFCASDDHLFWPASISLRDPSQFNLAAISHRHLADTYLLALACAHDGTLATFDRRIPLGAVVGASPRALEVIGA